MGYIALISHNEAKDFVRTGWKGDNTELDVEIHITAQYTITGWGYLDDHGKWTVMEDYDPYQYKTVDLDDRVQIYWPVYNWRKDMKPEEIAERRGEKPPSQVAQLEDRVKELENKWTMLQYAFLFTLFVMAILMIAFVLIVRII